MMNRWTHGLLAASFLMTTAAGATPASSEKEYLDETLRVGSQFELKAHPQGEELDAAIRATIHEDGTQIELAGRFRIGDSPLYYHLEIDLKEKSYKAIKKEVPRDWLNGRSEKSGSDHVTTAITPGTWTAEVKLITEDPLQINLATTNNYVLWTIYSNGSMAINSAYGTCAAYDGTGPIDTHWYTQSCTRSFGSPWAQQVNGGYYNWDWGFDDRVTTTAHMIKIQPNNNATFYYWNSYSHAGEDSWILQADLFVNGTQVF